MFLLWKGPKHFLRTNLFIPYSYLRFQRARISRKCSALFPLHSSYFLKYVSMKRYCEARKTGLAKAPQKGMCKSGNTFQDFQLPVQGLMYQKYWPEMSSFLRITDSQTTPKELRRKQFTKQFSVQYKIMSLPGFEPPNGFPSQ